MINCAAIPEALLESRALRLCARRLYRSGAVAAWDAFIAPTAVRLFLDEIGELPLGIQAKLLRFLDQGEVQRLGSSDVFRVDVRVVAATNANLVELTQQEAVSRRSLSIGCRFFPSNCLRCPSGAARCRGAGSPLSEQAFSWR